MIKPNEYVRIAFMDYHTIMWVTDKPFSWSKGTIGKRADRVDDELNPEIKNAGIYQDNPTYLRFKKAIKGKGWIKWSSFPSYAKKR